MAKLERVGDLEIAQDLAHERSAYRVRVVAAVVMGLVLLAALLGLFGSGPLSGASRASGPLGVEYERFARLGARHELILSLPGGSGETDVGIGRQYLDDQQVQQITPQPASSTTSEDRLQLTFDEPPVEVTLVLEPQEIGFHRATVHGPGRAVVSFDQLVYP
jgi:hypothetical protein